MADDVTTPDCGHVLIPEVAHHDCSLGAARVDVFKADGLPVTVDIGVDQPLPTHRLTVPDLDDVIAVLQEARTAAAQVLSERGVRA